MNFGYSSFKAVRFFKYKGFRQRLNFGLDTELLVAVYQLNSTASFLKTKNGNGEVFLSSHILIVTFCLGWKFILRASQKNQNQNPTTTTKYCERQSTVLQNVSFIVLYFLSLMQLKQRGTDDIHGSYLSTMWYVNIEHLHLSVLYIMLSILTLIMRN